MLGVAGCTFAGHASKFDIFVHACAGMCRGRDGQFPDPFEENLYVQRNALRRNGMGDTSELRGVG